MIGAGQADGSFSVELMNFIGEDLAGIWTFSIYDTWGDGGHSATSIVFDINIAPSVPTAYVNYDAWSAGQVQQGYSASTNEFILTNIGSETLTVSAITDLSATDFSTNFNISSVNLTIVCVSVNELNLYVDDVYLGPLVAKDKAFVEYNV